MEAAIEKGRDLPSWYLDEPPLPPMGAFYLRAHSELSTERRSGMGLGPIPWSSVVQYGSRAGLNGAMVDTLILVIRQMDDAYQRWHDAEAKRQQQQQQGSTSTVPARRPKLLGN